MPADTPTDMPDDRPDRSHDPSDPAGGPASGAVGQGLRALATVVDGRYDPADPATLRLQSPMRGLAAPHPAARRSRVAFLAAAAVLVGFLLLAGAMLGTQGHRSAETPGAAPATGPAWDYSSGARIHWHAAYGFSVCGVFQPTLSDIDGKHETYGIHTHQDGVIHVHPFLEASDGANARMHFFGDMVGLRFLADGWVLPGGAEYRQGHVTCDGAPARVVAYRWHVDEPGRAPDVIDRDFGDIRFETDREAYTFAVVADRPGVTVAEPPSIRELDELNDMVHGEVVTPGPDQTGGSMPPMPDPGPSGPFGAGGPSPVPTTIASPPPGN